MNCISKKLLVFGLLSLVSNIKSMDYRFLGKEMRFENEPFINKMTLRQSKDKECSDRVNHYKPNKTLKRSSRKPFSLQRKFKLYDKSCTSSKPIDCPDSSNDRLVSSRERLGEGVQSEGGLYSIDEDFISSLVLFSSNNNK